MVSMKSSILPHPDSTENLKDLFIISLLRENETLSLAHSSLQEKYSGLIEQIKLAQNNRFGRSSEKNVSQADLFDEAGSSDDESKEPEMMTIPEHKRTKHKQAKRTTLPENLPREKVVHDVDETDKQCACGCAKTQFGEEITEQLDIIPAQFKVIQHVRPKYVCKQCEGNISIASMPNLLLPKRIAAPGLVAYTVTSKYIDHIPLYRQEGMLRRYGITIPRSTNCSWILETADLCQPIIALLVRDIISSGYVKADETPVQVLKEPARRNDATSYMWLYRGIADGYTAVVYDYQETRSAQHAQNFLQDFQGYLQTDGYKGYDWSDKQAGIIHLACMTHARRPFANLVKISKKAVVAHEAIAYIAKLYEIEKIAREEKPQSCQTICLTKG